MTWQQRYQSKIKENAETDCWEWMSTKDKDGYGVLTVDGKKRKAHRLALELEGVQIAGLLVLHLCDNPGCVNPDHLVPGTQADNMRHMALNERGCIKVTREQVREIRMAYSSGDYVLADLALEYGLSFQHVSAIVNGIFRKDVV